MSEKYFLLGDSINKLSGSRSPTLQQLLQYFLYLHWEVKMTKSDSAAFVVKNAKAIWDQKRAETKRSDSIANKLIKESDEWYALHRNRSSKTGASISKRETYAKN